MEALTEIHMRINLRPLITMGTLTEIHMGINLRLLIHWAMLPRLAHILRPTYANRPSIGRLVGRLGVGRLGGRSVRVGRLGVGRLIPYNPFRRSGILAGLSV